MNKPIIATENPPVDLVKYVLNISNKILNNYKNIIDAYVLDFFTCSHWNKLPMSWRSFFSTITLEDLQIFLNVNKEINSRHQVWPLEIICLHNIVKCFTVPRDISKKQAVDEIEYRHMFSNLKHKVKLEKLLWKHVKSKKQHEIKSFVNVISKTAAITKCRFVVDVGSGLGHLDRSLTYTCGLRTCGIECNEKLIVQARNLDKSFEKQARVYDKDILLGTHTPVHVHYLIERGVDSVEFVNLIQDAFEVAEPFGIVGLHPCGDLGPTLLRLYQSCPNIKFINIVGCCYMKLTTRESSSNHYGYPMSRFALENKFHLSYNAREVACHAIESYLDRLKTGQHWQLKIHAYRAALEYLIVGKYPQLGRTALANVKYHVEMSFSEYCVKALKHIDTELITKEDEHSEVIETFLRDWRAVVTFYSIRLFFASLIESVILLDRYLYLREETDGTCSLITLFDPLLSPRNHVLIGKRGQQICSDSNDDVF